MSALEFVDDSTLPCGYCCGYTTDPEIDDWENPVPCDADGNPLHRMYSHVHPSCEQSVAEHVADAR